MIVSDNVSIADDYYNDSGDLLYRYNITADRYLDVKSRRLKAFIDLRISFECILKAYVVYYLCKDKNKTDIIRELVRYGHSIEKLVEDVIPLVPEDNVPCLIAFGCDLKELPVGLRYKLDCFELLDSKEELYYRTVGTDEWINKLYDCTINLYKNLGQELNSCSKIICGKDMKKDLDDMYLSKCSSK